MRAQERHQLKEDKFSKTTMRVAENTVHWSVEHKGKIAVGAVVLVILAAAIFGGWYYVNQQDQKASLSLSQAVRTLDTPVRPAGMPAQPENPSFASAKERATEARKKFQAVVDQYPRTRSGDMARYFVGVTSSDLGDNAAAERALKEVASSHDDELAALANFALASVYRRENRTKEAIEIYKKLADKPTRTVGKATAQLELANTYQTDNQPLEAKRVYQDVQKQNPTSEASQMASQKLQALK
ncbi:MAG TPA: tetratricopeptide repeat protein [Terriglobales bacterium]|nr:tetratricopeptide repeat protein [Terriglobales bacterium]